MISQFSDVQYLRSKNAVDKLSRSSEIWHMLEKQVCEHGSSAACFMSLTALGAVLVFFVFFRLGVM